MNTEIPQTKEELAAYLNSLEQSDFEENVPHQFEKTEFPGQPERGPVNNALEGYDNETLNYLYATVKDSYLISLLKQIESSRLTKDAKKRLWDLGTQFFDKEAVINNFKNGMDEEQILNGFREVAKYTKIGLRKIDATNEFYKIMSQIETHHARKIKRAIAGFERLEQQTQRVKQPTEYKDGTEKQPPQPQGLRGAATGLYKRYG